MQGPTPLARAFNAGLRGHEHLRRERLQLLGHAPGEAQARVCWLSAVAAREVDELSNLEQLLRLALGDRHPICRSKRAEGCRQVAALEFDARLNEVTRLSRGRLVRHAWDTGRPPAPQQPALIGAGLSFGRVLRRCATEVDDQRDDRSRNERERDRASLCKLDRVGRRPDVEREAEAPEDRGRSLARAHTEEEHDPHQKVEHSEGDPTESRQGEENNPGGCSSRPMPSELC